MTIVMTERAEDKVDNWIILYFLKSLAAIRGDKIMLDPHRFLLELKSKPVPEFLTQLTAKH